MTRNATKRLFLATLASLGLAAAADAGDLTIEVVGVRSEIGILMIAVFDSAESFLKDDQEAAAIRLLARGRAERVTLVGLPAGDYAVAVYHDENRNQKLDRNLVGMPREGNGFSRDAAGSFGPPKFDAAKLTLDAASTLASVKLAY